MSTVDTPQSRIVTIDGLQIHLARPQPVPDCPTGALIGRKNELTLCKAAWDVDSTNHLASANTTPLHFRLEGAPGVGKNELVYELARQLHLPLYIIQGHEELQPEDLALLLVPDPTLSRSDAVPFVLRASPLTTALYEGGLFFFDEINRVPERALSPLSAVLDGRRSIFSAITGVYIEPKDEQAKKRFRFCCALNPALNTSGHVLPPYIAQRTLPVIKVEPPPPEELLQIIQHSFKEYPEEDLKKSLDDFKKYYSSQEKYTLSVREALNMIAFAMNSRRTVQEVASHLQSGAWPDKTTNQEA